MDDADLQLRNEIYRRFVETGRPPHIDDRAALRRLHDQHAVVLDDADQIRMLNPFSLVPTPHRVHAGGRWWYGNCAWDALGVIAALGGEGRYETSCPDCAEAIEIDVRDGGLEGGDLVFHLAVPAASWWDDIVFT
ncbi:MAG: organomercurial lyase [Gaiellaceae bacterium]